jgi:hypothetical protein
MRVRLFPIVALLLLLLYFHASKNWATADPFGVHSGAGGDWGPCVCWEADIRTRPDARTAVPSCLTAPQLFQGLGFY